MSTEHPRGAGDVAITGLALRFPGADNLEELFDHLVAGRSLISEVPAQRWSKERWFGDPRRGAEKTSSIWGGFIEQADCFDADFFNISPREAEGMDPQQRFALELSWQAIEDAGYRAGDLAGSRTGVFMGVCHQDYAELMERDGAKTDAYFPTGTAYSIISNRVSYLLDLQGPSITNDTACSSSLVSVYEAVSALRNGECEQALAGGVNLCWSPKHFVAFSQASMLSRTGRSKAFDQDADGYVRGEGGAVLLLKPLERAVADGDPVHAVIRGVATNHGGRTSSLTVTNPAAQAELIEGLYTRTGIRPETVNYIEAHGPGTPVGDPIEVVALKRAFANLHAKNGTDAQPNSTGIGSIKTNIGHLEGAAGVAGMVKVIGSMAGRSLPATVNFETQNRLIQLDGSPFFIVRDTQEWPEAVAPRRAGVSSFGFGGTNAHVVLEEHPADEAREPVAGPYVVPLSAKTPERLRAVARGLAEHLRGPAASVRAPQELADVAYTLQIGREPMAARVAFVVADTAELIAALDSFEDGSIAESAAHARAEAPHLLAIAKLWAEGGEVEWSELYGDGPRPRRVRLPVYPFARERYWFVVPDREPEQPSAGALHPLVHRNTSDLAEQRYSSTFTGDEPFLAAHQVRGARILPAVAYLEMVRAAAEHALGEEAADGVLNLRDVAWTRPIVAGDDPVNVHVGLAPEDSSIAFEVYGGSAADPVAHSRGAVELAEPVAAEPLDLDALRAACPNARDAAEVYAAFHDEGLEYGAAMRGLREIFLGERQLLARIERPADSGEGFVLEPSVLDAAFQASVVLLDTTSDVPASGPTLPFALERVEVFRPCAGEMWAWVRRREDSGAVDKFDIDLCEADGVISARLHGLVQRRESARRKASVVTAITGWVDAPLHEGAETPAVHGFYAGRAPVEDTSLTHLPAIAPDQVGEGVEHTLDVVFQQVQEVVASTPKQAHRFVVLVDDRLPRHFHAPLTGLFRTVALENPLVSGKVVRVAGPAPLPEILRAEAADERDDAEVRYAADGTRQVWQPIETEAVAGPRVPPLKDGGVYWLTGGLGGLGQHFARYFARREGIKVVLSGRSEPGSALAELRESGADAHHIAVDVTDGEDVLRVAREIVREHGSIDGIVHAAGLLRDEYVLRKDLAQVREVLAPKVRGTLNLDAASRELSLDFFIAFSSVAGVYGNPGQADYAAANAFLDAFARHREVLVEAGERTGRTVAMSWPLWADGGMTVDEVTRESMRRQRGWEPLPTEDGLRALGRVLDDGPEHVVVAYGADATLAPKRREEPAAAPVTVSAELASGDLAEGAAGLLKELLGQVLHRAPDSIESEVNLVEYGIDSLSILDMTTRLEDLFGPLSKTLFFEYTTIEGVAGYFVASHGDKLAAILGASAEAEQGEAADTSDTGEDVHAENTDAGSTPRRDRRSRFARTAATQITVRPDPREDYHDIAVIGISGKYPGANTLDELWSVLEEGRHSFTEVPRERWDYDAIYSRERSVLGKSSIRTGTFLDEVDKFDPRYFRVSKRAAEQMSPEVRLFLQAGVEALEDAGYSRETIQRQYDGDVGVLAGTMSNHYNLYGFANNLLRGASASGSYTATLPNMLSYFYGLTGPSIFLDTMCSAASTCIHQAVQMLRARETKMVVAGGANLLLHPYNLISSSQEHFTTATSDVIRSYGVGADGTILGEGVGAVILKPLVEAERDGDHIYAVIKGTALSNAGVRNGFTVPNPHMQARAIEKAIDDAGVDPRTISYVEGHGSGTSLGDPIEVKALTTAFRKYTAESGYCALGSVKSNMGHLLAAAGMVGFAKVMLQLREAKLAPSLHSGELNPDISFGDTPFRVQRELAEWEPVTTVEDGRAVTHPRRAGITSIGAGGMNSHIIVEEYTARAAPEAGDGRDELFVFSAINDDALTESLTRFRDFLADADEADLSAIAFTLRVGKNELPHRWAFLAGDKQSALAAVGRYLSGDRDLDAALASSDSRAEVAREVAATWVGGKAVDWSRVVGARAARRVSLPAYPFDRVRCWMPQEDGAPSVLAPLALRQKTHPLLGRNESDLDGLRYVLDVHFDDLRDYSYQRDKTSALVPTFVLDLALGAAKVAGFADASVRNLRAGAVSWATTARLVTTFDGVPGESASGAVFAEDASGARALVAEFDVAPGEGPSGAAGVPADVRGEAVRVLDREQIAAELADGGLDYEELFSGLQSASWLPDGRLVLEVGEPAVRRDHVLRNVTVDPTVLSAIARAVQLAAKRAGMPRWEHQAPQRIDEIRVLAGADVAHVVLELTDGRVRLVGRDGSIVGELAGLRCGEAETLDATPAVPRALPATAANPGVRASVPVQAPETSASIAEPEPGTGGRSEHGVVAFVIGQLREMAAELLKFDVEELDVHTGFDAFGFDSISLVALSKQVHERFGVKLNPAVFFDMSTFDALGRHLVAEFGEQVRAVHERSVTEPAAEANVGSGLRTDSDSSKPSGSRDGAAGHDSAGNGLAADGSPSATAQAQPSETGNQCGGRKPGEPIAIIGASGRFPGARDLDEFWSNLLAGEDSVSEFPIERYDATYARIVEESDFPRHAGVLRDVDAFDAGFFGIYPREAELMDPQHRLTLETIWKALEDSAYAPADLPKNTGLFFGVSGTDYATLLNTYGVAPDAYTSTGNAHSMLVNRVSYLLDIRGPSEPVDTACSSSLVAVHRAAEAIRAGSCDVAIAGGVNLLLSVDTFVSAHRAGMLSPDGRCKTFAQGADGYVRGEGVGAVILKPLAQAERDGDAILGVLRGTAENHGGRANSLTAPNADAQAELVSTAMAGLDPGTVGYVETHGTGTALGDPVEIRALQSAFQRLGGGGGRTGLGSVKTNIGHLEAAAGIAGLLKVLLALKHRMLPATRTSGPLNPYIQLDGSPFHIVRENEPWEPARDRDGALAPLRAGVSSFGFGGANCHVVVEEHTGVARADREFSVVVPISARTDSQLRDIARNLLAHLENPGEPVSLGSLAWSLQAGREAMDERAGWVVGSLDELAGRLHEFLDGHVGGDVRGRVARRKGGLAERIPDADLARELREAVARGDLGQVLARWVEGVVVDWRSLYRTEVPARAHLPTYPFARERYWIPDGEADSPAHSGETTAHSGENPAAPAAEIGTALLTPSWTEQAVRQDRAVPARRVVIACGEMASACGDIERRVPDARCVPATTDKIRLDSRFTELSRQVFEVMRGLAAEESTLVQVVAPSTGDNATGLALAGLLRTAALENPKINVQLIGLDGAATGDAVATVVVENASSADDLVVYRNGVRTVRTWSAQDPVTEPESPWRANGVYLITGGAQGIGAIVARRIADEVASPVLYLAGRSPRDERVDALLGELRTAGAVAEYRQADVSRWQETRHLVESVRAESGALHGVLHSAGVIRDAALADKTAEQWDEVLAPKVSGLVNLDRATADLPLEFLIAFSSGAAVTGNHGQADYAAANAFLDEFAGLRAGRVRSIAWPLWRDGGMTVDEAARAKLWQSRGLAPMESAAGVAALMQAWQLGQHQVWVHHGDLSRVPSGAGKPVAAATRPRGASSGLEREVLRRLVELFARATKLPTGTVDADEQLGAMGLDSIMVVQLNKDLAAAFGEVSKTLFYEFPTLREVAAHLASEHTSDAIAWTGHSPQDEPAANPVPAAKSASVTARVPQPAQRDRERSADEPIAIIGLSGRYPHAGNVAEFWENLKSGRDCVGEVPADRWELDGFFEPDQKQAIATGRSYSKWGGFLDGFAEFDPRFFQIAPRDAYAMDPQERLFLQASWEVLEDAGYTRERIARDHSRSVGVFAGVTKSGHARHGAGRLPSGEAVVPGLSFASVSARTSYFLDLRGPSLTLDTMCSASLTAIHEACEHLRRGSCELAIAGGVNLYVHPLDYVELCRSKMLSTDSRCRSFGAGGDGFVPGEGVGAVLLKPLSAALADGDCISAVIRGSSINHGGSANGYTVPNPGAQAELIRDALGRAGISARDVSFVEAHGTGTELGDPIEIKGLTSAFEQDTAERAFCAIGSVKSAIGHLEAAAGAAGLTKAVLQLRHRQLAPSLHAEEPNPNISFDKTPFVVQRELADWEADRPRVAAVSSFGAGGSNAHVIVQEHVADPVPADAAGEQLVVLSARTPDQLQQSVRRLLDFLDREDPRLPELANTLQTGREAMRERLAVVTPSTSDLRRVLRAFLDEGAEAAGAHRGTAGRAQGALAAIAEDADLQELLVARWAAAGKLGKLAALWVDGVRLDWSALHGGEPPRRISLPTYPFARDRFWIGDLEPAEDRHAASAAEAPQTAGPNPIPTAPPEVSSEVAPAPQSPRVPLDEEVRRLVREKLARALAMHEDEIDGAHAFADYGLDSILGVRLVHELNDALSLNLSVSVIYDFSSADRLVDHLLGEHGASIQLTEGVAPEPVRSAEPVAAANPYPTATPTQRERSDQPDNRAPIAIVGMSGRFAGSDDLDELWDHLVAGDDLVTRAARWDLETTDDDGEPRCAHGSFLDRIDEFDPLFFNISGVEASIMDPQQRLLLEESWKALEDAGYAGQMGQRRCGVYVGAWAGDYQDLLDQDSPAQTLWGNMTSVIPSRVSYCLDLKGPAIAVDTSCSSSLVAIDLACKDLWSGETSMALAGGVFLQSTPRLYRLAGRAGMLSPTGRCHTFDHRADGFVPGEGVGVLVLKRLADALDDGDHIHGVIRGSGVNQDGATNGITAPSSLSQESLLRDVYESFDVDVEKIQMVEAHGTGTSLGDPIEFQALSRAFRKDTDKSGYCAVGSIKTNIGHTQFAAGVAGVFKILLGMKHEQIPASLHFEKPNKAIPIDGSPFYMSTRTHKWEAPLDAPRCGVVSSFGASGTNAHLVLEEAPLARRVPAPRPAYLVVLSARSKEQLAEQVTRLAAHCRREPSVDCGDLAYTLTVGREHFEHRFACVVRDVDELIGVLDEGLGSTRASTGRKSALDNGSDAAQIGAESLRRCRHAASESALRADFGTLAELYVRGVVLDYAQVFPEGAHLRVPLPRYPFARERYWPEQSASAPQEPVTAPATQPAPTAPSSESGLMLGAASPVSAEPGALCARTTLNGAEPYVRDHKVHGRRVLPGVAYLEMAREIGTQALGADSATSLVMRNVTWVQPLVVETEPVDAEVVTNPLRGGGISFEVAARAAERVVFCEGRIARSDGVPPARVDLAALRENCPTSVSADHIREALGAMGIEHGPALRAIDTAHVGAGIVLAKLDAPAIDRSDAVLDPAMLDSAVQASMALQLAEGAASQETAVPFALDRLEFFGECTDSMWAVVRAQDTSTPGPLSTLDIDLVGADGTVRVRMTGYSSRRAQEPLPAMFEPVWDAVPSEELGSPVPLRDDRVLVVGGTAQQRQAIARDCAAAMAWNLPPTASIDEITESLSAIDAIDHLVWFAPEEQLRPTDAQGFVAAQENGVLAAFRMVKSLLRAGYDARALGITLITQRGIPTHAAEKIQPTHAGLHGLFGALGREYANWSVRRVDLEDADWPEDLAALPARARDDIWVQRCGQWLRRRLAPTETADVPAATYREGGVYVVIGGAGGLGVAWTQHVVEHYGATVVWIGRRERDDSIEAKLGGIPGEVHYIAADATDPDSLRRAHAEITARYGQVNGVIQAALVLRDQSLARMDEEVFRASVAAKVDVSVAMAQIFADEPLDFVLFFSSLQSFTTAAGQSNYAAGCTFADSYAHYLAQHWTCPVKVMNWGWWGSVGSVSSEFFTRRMRQWGLDSIEPPEGMAALDELFASPQPQLSFVKMTRPDALDIVDMGTRTAAYGRSRTHVDPGAVRSHDALNEGSVLETIAEWRANERDPLLAKMIRAHFEVLGIAHDAAHTELATLRERGGILERYTTWLEHALRVMPESAPPLDVITREWKQRCAEWSQDPDKKAELRLVDATLAQLPEILTGHTRPTDVLFPRGSVELVEGCYRNNRMADAFNRAMCDAALSIVSERVRQDPEVRLRILEIGAGTGGTSVGMFATLKPYQTNIETYTYTDLSKAFLNHARTEYGPDVPYLECALFNAENPLAGQGIEPGSYDLVIAANVLHATRDTRNTLRNAKAAMRDGGWLLLNELAAFDVFTHLTFGLLEGWWLFEDKPLRVPGSPALSPNSWQDVLEAEGFPSVVFVLPEALALGQQIIAAESDGIARQQLTNGEIRPSARPRPAAVRAGASGPVASGATEPKPVAPTPIVPTPISAAPAAEVSTPVPASGAVGLLVGYLREKAAETLKVPADRIDSSAPLVDYGLDSILVLQLANALREDLDEVSPTLLFEAESVDGFVERLLEAGGSEVNALIRRLRPIPPEIQASADISMLATKSELSALILDKAAAVLGIPADRINTSAPLTDYGLDSILVLQLTNSLREHLGDDVSATLLFDVESIDSLCAHFAGTAGERRNLSRSQLNIYRDHQRWGESTTYNLPLLFEIHGDLDETALERAIHAQTEIHPVLSAVFGERDGVPYMDIDPTRTPSFDRVDIAATSRVAQLAKLRELVDVPFDLATGPLVRAHLVSLAGQRRLLLITAHHILLDGTSTAVLIRTLKDAYQGKGSLSRATYGDFVAWEEAMLAGPRAQQHRDYWVRELEGPRTTLALPYDRPYDPKRMPRVNTAMIKLSPQLVTALEDKAREYRVSVATVLFTTYVRFLHRLTGQNDLITGMTTAARYEQRFQDVVGQFANCLPIRCEVTGSFPELLKSVQHKVVAGIEHGAYPLLEITRALGIDNEPLVLTNFLFQNFDGAELLTNDSPAGHGELDLRLFDDLPYAGEYVLSAELYREGEGYKVFLKYDANVFDENTARRMVEEWHSIIQGEMGV